MPLSLHRLLLPEPIGTFSVRVPNTVGGGLENITFSDTPGHAAFSAMRARRADVTDIVVLVVASDDGVRPQTKEVIQLVQKDPDVQLIVAVNKIDKPGIDIVRLDLHLGSYFYTFYRAMVKTLLAEVIQLEAMGGLDHLMETITAVAEMQDLRAEHEGRAWGRIIESKFQKGLGHVATVLLLRGSLKPGAHLVAGTTHAKVRVMTDLTGWKEPTGAGDEVLEGSEQDVKKAVDNRLRKAEEQAMTIDIDAINTQRRLEREQRERDEADQPASEMTHETEKLHELRFHGWTTSLLMPFTARGFTHQ
ncbi:P-loop containing nucleoside triphosphate hydrolase protein [Russula emetica]|nr:P-loop containing nucleoside triphosphate hydrolase protein [Russula emetica]